MRNAFKKWLVSNVALTMLLSPAFAGQSPNDLSIPDYRYDLLNSHEGHFWAGGGHEDAGATADNLSVRAKIELLRKKVKYVFVIFHENESFDHYFGTFPGANGLFSAPAASRPRTRPRASRSATSTPR